MEGFVSLIVLAISVIGTIVFVNRNTRDRSSEEDIARVQAERAKIKEALSTQKNVTKTKEKEYEEAIKEFNRISSNNE